MAASTDPVMSKVWAVSLHSEIIQSRQSKNIEKNFKYFCFKDERGSSS